MKEEMESTKIHREHPMFVAFLRHLDSSGYCSDVIIEVVEKPWKWGEEFDHWALVEDQIAKYSASSHEGEKVKAGYEIEEGWWLYSTSRDPSYLAFEDSVGWDFTKFLDAASVECPGCFFDIRK